MAMTFEERQRLLHLVVKLITMECRRSGSRGSFLPPAMAYNCVHATLSPSKGGPSVCPMFSDWPIAKLGLLQVAAGNSGFH